MNALTRIVVSDTGTTAVDPRLAFLARAAARHYMVEVGEMDLGAAFDGLIPAFEAMCPCQCDRDRLDRWERQDRHYHRRRRRQ